jgi:hypothetical protein
MRMDPEVLQASRQAAALERQSLSGLIEALLVAHCKRLKLLTRAGRSPPRGWKSKT